MIHLPPLPPFVLGLSDQEHHEVEVAASGWAGPSDCNICSGSRSFRWYAYESVEWMSNRSMDPLVIREYECPCAEQWLLHRHLLGRGILRDYQTLSLRDFESRDKQDVAIGYIGEIDLNIRYGVGMLLTGSHGTGKSMLSALVVKAATSRNVSAYYTTFGSMIETYVQTKFSAEDRNRLKAKLKAAKLLVIDELGNELKMKWERDVSNEAKALLDDVLRFRNGNKLCTFVTTNLDMAQIAKLYGSNVESLLTTFDHNEFRGDDFRVNTTARLKSWRLLL